MAAPKNRIAVIKTFTPEENVTSVRLLGYGPVDFTQEHGVLIVKLPEKLPTEYTNCLAVEFA